jgi:hypothetical protein
VPIIKKLIKLSKLSLIVGFRADKKLEEEGNGPS